MAQRPTTTNTKALDAPRRGLWSIAPERWLNKLLILVVIVTGIFSCQTPTDDSLTIAGAANLQYALRALTASFTAETGIDCELVFASSGKLTAQISEGAPFDVFLAADEKYPASLHAKQLTLGPPVTYAYGRLALWSTLPDFQPTLAGLTAPRIRSIAIPNPITAPYGQAAVAALRQQELYDSIAPKLVFGESVAQANQFVTAQAAEVGFTAVSVVMAPAMERYKSWIIVDEKSYAPIAQSAVVIDHKGQKKHPSGEAFLNFLVSKKGKEILAEFGYLLPD
ncbi:MAG: molybdate ABC transporter substrate-binding protein [Bacteroidota bacterium]